MQITPKVDSPSFRLAPSRGLSGLAGVGRLTWGDCGRREPPERSTSKEHRHQFVWPPERWIAFMCPPLVALCDTAPRRFAWPPLPAPLSANQPMRRHLRPTEVRLPPRPLAAMAAPPPVRLQDSIPPCAPPAEVHCLPFELESGDTTESSRGAPPWSAWLSSCLVPNLQEQEQRHQPIGFSVGSNKMALSSEHVVQEVNNTA